MNAIILSVKKMLVAGLFAIATSGSIAGTASVTYIPVRGSEGVFNVVYNNEAGSRFVLQILDQDGNELYESAFTDRQFSRNFRLADPDGYSKLVFVIRNPKEKTIQRFEVETTTHLMEEVDVKEIK